MMMDDLNEREITKALLPQPQEDSQVRWQLDFEEIVQRFEQELRGYVWDPAQRDWVAGGKRVMTDEGIRQVIGIINNHVNKTTILSNLSPEVVELRCRKAHMALNTSFIYNFEKWELDISDARTVTTEVMNLIHLGLLRALNQGERRFIKEGGFSRETRVESAAKSRFAGLIR